MKIYVFGANGMLGRYVTAYLLRGGYNVIPVTRGIMDIRDASYTRLSTFIQLNGGININDVIVNCAGLIKQKMAPGDDIDAIKVNSVFPRLLSDFSSNNSINFIHISTDCCFSGTRGNYTEEDKPDPQDMYGITKVAGEPDGCMVIRTSVIGEGEFSGSLMEWVKRQTEINGFTNHLWNGVTCLQLAKEISKIIKGDKWFGIRHYFSTPITKAELVRIIAKSYGKDIVIHDTEASVPVNRTLNTIYKGTFDYPPDIRSQIDEQRDFFNA